LQKTLRLLYRLSLLIFFIACAPLLVSAQKKDSVPPQRDSLQHTVSNNPVNQNHPAKDSTPAQKDSVLPTVVIKPVDQYQAATDSILAHNIFLNSTGTPVVMIIKPKAIKSNDLIFYILAALIFCMGLIRLYFSRYFTNLFRVFFNTSLRQSQLADQLLQAKLPSLFFNAFFIISGGIYIYILLQQYQLITGQHRWMLMGGCIVVLGLIYLLKFSSLKFTGWVTGYKEATDSYIFVNGIFRFTNCHNQRFGFTIDHRSFDIDAFLPVLWTASKPIESQQVPLPFVYHRSRDNTPFIDLQGFIGFIE
jgi:hypothetical protein